MHERNIDHGRFIEDQEIGIEGVVLVLAKPSALWVDLQKPMDGFGLLSCRLAHALGGAPRRRTKKHLHALGFENAKEGVHKSGLADTWSAGNDKHLRGERLLDCLFLAFRQRDSGFGLNPGKRLFDLDRWPRWLAGSQP